MRLPRGRGKKRARASAGIAVPMAQRAYARRRAKNQRERGMRVSHQAESSQCGHQLLISRENQEGNKRLGAICGLTGRKLIRCAGLAPRRRRAKRCAGTP